jgi:hypothetical protein
LPSVARTPRLPRAAAALVHAVHLENMRAEGLEPGQQPLQRGEIGKLAVQDGLHRLYGGGELLKVEQRLGRENPGNADLVLRWCHRWPSQLVGMGQLLDHTMPWFRPWRATRTG